MAAKPLFPEDVFIPAGDDAPAIPLRELAPWGVFGLLLSAVFLYFVSTEEGAVALFHGMYIHEFVHDARHLLGFPCH